jgi:hypothetical protein
MKKIFQEILWIHFLIIITLSFYNNEPSKNEHFLILLSSLARNSQEPKLKRIFEIPWVLFEKSLSLYFDWSKSWIWWTLEKVMNIFCKWHFHNASKEVFWPKKVLNFMYRFKSAILAEWKNCQNGTFEPVHEIKKKIWPKYFLWGIMKVPFTKNIHNLYQGPSNPGFRSGKVQTETFLKKDSRNFKNSFQFRFLWIPSKTGEQI